MQYMLLIYMDPADAPPSESEGRQIMAAWADYTAALHEAGAHVSGDALHPADVASTVRVTDGERVVTDGPFAETKEWLAGYYVIDVPDLDAALDWAARMPSQGSGGGGVEVRPVIVFADQPA